MTYTFGVKGQKRNLFEVMKTTIHQSINMEKKKDTYNGVIMANEIQFIYSNIDSRIINILIFYLSP